MRRPTLPVELLLLAFLAVFLLYPLAYIIPGAASDEEYQVRLLGLGDSPEQQLRVAALLLRDNPGITTPLGLHLPYTIRSFPSDRPAQDLKKKYEKAGASVEVVRHRLWTTFYFREALGSSPFLWECIRNSLLLATVTTLATTLVCLPLAYWMTRYRFRGQGWLGGLLLVPLVLPPFVGAIGLQRFLERYGTLNLVLMRLGLLSPGDPIDWLGQGGFLGVAVMQVLYLYPILYLNLAAAWANIDPTLEDAARNLGAGEFRVFRTVTLPLLLPGYFAGASLVFVWSFTDLGTPLVFHLRSVIPVQIYDQVADPQRTNSVAYCLVLLVLAITALLFYSARWVVHRHAYLGAGKGAVAAAPPAPGRARTMLIYAGVLGLTLLAILPHLGVVLTAFAERWTFTALPDSWTTAYLQEAWTNPVAGRSLRNSVSYSACSTLADVVLGTTLAWLAVRRPSWLTATLDGLATLPLALPGLVLAFGYLTCYSNLGFGPWGALLDPTQNPVPLLIIAYTVRRLPYVTRSAQAGLQQVPEILEEAAANLGAGRWRIAWTVTVPLIAANLLAGAILTFAFAVLEVSDSLMLAREERYFPITRAIVGLLMRPDDGANLASALGVLAMGLLGLCLLVGALVLGRKLGQLFRT